MSIRETSETELTLANEHALGTGGKIYVTNTITRSLNKATLTDGHAAIAPDGNYLVYDDGDGNLTTLSSQPDGSWDGPRSVTQHGNLPATSIATISPDGKYLFYTYKGDLY